MKCSMPMLLLAALIFSVPTATVLAATVPAGTVADPPTHDTLRGALTQADEALGRGEPQIAESHLRDAQRYGWDLLGLLAAADGDLEAAHDAFERATMAAVDGVQNPRRHLALVRGQLGKTNAALHQLRSLTEKFPQDTRAWEALIKALMARERVEEARYRVDDLRNSLPRLAAGLDPLLAEGKTAGFALDLGPLAAQSSSERDTLRQAVVGDLAFIHLQHGLIHARAGRIERAIEDFQAALGLDSEITDSELDVSLPAENPRLAKALKKSLSQLAMGHTEKSTKALRRAFPASIWQGGYPIRSPEGLLKVLDSLRGSFVEVVRDFETGDFYSAEHWLKMAEEQGRSSPESRELLRILQADRSRSALLLLQLAGAAERSKAKSQISFLEQALLLAPNSEEALAAHGRVHIRDRLWLKARHSLEPLSGIFPDNAEYAHLYGLALMHLGEMADAATALQKAVENDPRRRAAMLDLGRALNQEKRYAEARVHLTTLAEADPDNLDAQSALAETEEGLDQLDAAQQRAETVLARQTDHPAAHMVLGMVHMKSRRFAEARDALVAAVKADPDHAKAHYQLSLAYARLGENKKAQYHLKIYERKAEGPEVKAMSLLSGPGVKTMKPAKPAASPEETKTMKKSGGGDPESRDSEGRDSEGRDSEGKP